MKAYRWCKEPCNECKYKRYIGYANPVCAKRWKWKLIKVPRCKEVNNT